MCTVDINILLKKGSYPQAGDYLYDFLIKNIDKENRIVLNMQDVDVLPSLFLNTSIGRFITEYGFDKLRAKVSFSNISVSQAERIRIYIKRKLELND
jgi:hypothetical protein